MGSADVNIVDPECDIAVATMAQLLLQQGKVTEALQYFERAAELSRTEGEIVNALSYAEATRTQLEVQEKYPQLAGRLVCTLLERILPLLARSMSRDTRSGSKMLSNPPGLSHCSDLCLEEGSLTPKPLQQGMGASIGGPMR